MHTYPHEHGHRGRDRTSGHLCTQGHPHPHTSTQSGREWGKSDRADRGKAGQGWQVGRIGHVGSCRTIATRGLLNRAGWVWVSPPTNLPYSWTHERSLHAKGSCSTMEALSPKVPSGQGIYSERNFFSRQMLPAGTGVGHQRRGGVSGCEGDRRDELRKPHLCGTLPSLSTLQVCLEVTTHQQARAPKGLLLLLVLLVASTD